MSNMMNDLFSAEEIHGRSYREWYPWMKEKKFICVKTIDELKNIVDEAIKAGHCSLDLEASGLDTRIYDGVCKSFIVGFSVCYDGVAGYYIPINHGIEDDLKQYTRNPKWSLDEDAVRVEIQRLIDNSITILHNVLYDHEMMSAWGIKIRELLPDGKTPAFQDTLLLAYVGDCGRKNKGLKFLSETMNGMKMLELVPDIFAKGQEIKFHLLDPTEDKAVVYAASDAICTFWLYRKLAEEGVEKDERRGIYNVERKCSFAIRDMERARVRIDAGKLRKYKIDLEALSAEIEKEATQVYGEPFNLGSTQQVGNILFTKYGLTELQEKDDKGELVFDAKNNPKINTDEDSISKFKDRCPLIPLILLHRNISKTLGTYIDNFLDGADEAQEVKFQFIPHRTETGRFASPGGEHEHGYSGVNIQALTKPDDDTDLVHKDGTPFTFREKIEKLGSGFFLRSALIARPGYKIVAIDYSGQELRIATNLSKEPIWIKEFLEGEGDLHSQTASLAYQIPLEKIDPKGKERGNCKTLNFQTVYGGGPRGVADMIGISVEEAKLLQQRMLGGLKGLKSWIDLTKKKAHKTQYAETPLHRRRPLPFISSPERELVAKAERIAVNTPIQGCGGDVMKVAMMRVREYIRGLSDPSEVRMIITIHDELVFEIKADKLDEHCPKLMNIMALPDIVANLKWLVPFSMDCEVGDSWDVDYEYFKKNPQAVNKLESPLREAKARALGLDPVTLESKKKKAAVQVESAVVEATVISEPEPPKTYSFDDSALKKALEAYQVESEEDEIAFKRGLETYLKEAKVSAPTTAVTEAYAGGKELLQELATVALSWKRYYYKLGNPLVSSRTMTFIKYLMSITPGNNPFVLMDSDGQAVISEKENVKIDAVAFEILARHYNL